MLQTIREHTQGWIAGTIIFLLIISFALWGIHSYFVGGGATTEVAEVNGVAISKAQLNVAYERLKRQIQNQFGINNPFQGKDELIRSRALKGLIDNEVLRQASITQGFLVTDQQINNYLQSMPEFQVDGQFSFDKFQQILTASMLPANDFLEIIRNNLLVAQPHLAIIASTAALPDETQYTISLINQERDFDYIKIPNQYFMADKRITISADKVSAYYNAHKQEFKTPETVSLEYLQLTLNDLMKNVPADETTLRNYYQDNMNSYRLPRRYKLEDVEIPVDANASALEVAKVKKTATRIAEGLKKGSPLSQVADTYAHPLKTKDWLTINLLPTPYQKPVSALTAKGEVTEPFRSPTGFVVVRVIAIEEPRVQAYDDIKERVRDSYARQRAEERFAETRDRLADLTYEHPDTLQQAAKELNLPILVSETFTRKEGQGVAEDKKVRDIAFSDDVLNQQNNSDVIPLDPETFVVIRIKSHTLPKQLTLEEVSPKIIEILKAQETLASVKKLAEDMLIQLEEGKDAGKLAETLKLTWVKNGYLGQFANKVDPAISELAFRLPNKNVPTFGLARLNDGFAIVRLNSVKNGSALPEKQYKIYEEQIQASDGQIEYELYKQSQIKSATIKMM